MDPNTIEVHGLDIVVEQTKQSPSLIEIFLVARLVDVFLMGGRGRESH